MSRIPFDALGRAGPVNLPMQARSLVSDAALWQAYHFQGVERPLNFMASDVRVTLEGEDGASGAYARVELDPVREPWLTWQWSLRKSGDTRYPLVFMIGFDIPEGEASPEVLAWADTVEKVEGIRPPLRAIGYVFGGSHPPDVAETPLVAPGAMYLINLRGNADCDGRIVTECRDIGADYRALFREPAPNITAIALLGDARGSCNQLSATLISPSVCADEPLGVMEPQSADPEATMPALSWVILVVAAIACILSGIWLTRRLLPSKKKTGSTSDEFKKSGPA